MRENDRHFSYFGQSICDRFAQQFPKPVQDGGKDGVCAWLFGRKPL